MTNEQIKKIVEEEMKNMRKDINKIIFHKHRTGYCVAIYSDMGLNSRGEEMTGSRIKKETEWALITTKMLHRIMSAKKILAKIREDKRLYD